MLNAEALESYLIPAMESDPIGLFDDTPEGDARFYNFVNSAFIQEAKKKYGVNDFTSMTPDQKKLFINKVYPSIVDTAKEAFKESFVDDIEFLNKLFEHVYSFRPIKDQNDLEKWIDKLFQFKVVEQKPSSENLKTYHIYICNPKAPRALVNLPLVRLQARHLKYAIDREHKGLVAAGIIEADFVPKQLPYYMVLSFKNW